MISIPGQLKIHARGFCGSPLAGVMHMQAPPDGYANRPLEQPQVMTFVANEVVAKLFEIYTLESYSKEDFDWMADAIAKLAKAFGTRDLQMWHMAQYSSPGFSDMHVDYLEDCFRFAMTGKTNVDQHVWAQLLTAGKESASNKEELKQYTALYLNKALLIPFSNEKITVMKFIADILRHPGGLDFLFTMVNNMFTGK